MDTQGTEAEALVSFYSAGITGLMMERRQIKDPDVDELARQIYRIAQQPSPTVISGNNLSGHGKSLMCF